jgi:hypothetical protein
MSEEWNKFKLASHTEGFYLLCVTYAPLGVCLQMQWEFSPSTFLTLNSLL